MSVLRASGIFCAACAFVWMGHLAIAEDQAVYLFDAPRAEVIDVSYTYEDKNPPSNQSTNSQQASPCDSGNCGSCTYNGCCQPVWHWTMGVEATYLDTVVGDGTSIGWNAGPRIWLGLENCDGWGVRARYWQLGATAFFVDQPLTSSPSTTDTFDQLFHLDLYTIDVEATKRGELGDWAWLAFLGGRYAGSNNQILTDIAEIAPVTNDVFIDNVHAQAGGITTGFKASHALGEGPLAVYGGVRVSALWGNADFEHIARLNVGGIQSNFASAGSDSLDLTIWEAQVGLQCSKYLACCQGTAFARCGFEYQGWRFVTGQPNSVLLNDLDMYGVAFAVGITR